MPSRAVAGFCLLFASCLLCLSGCESVSQAPQAIPATSGSPPPKPLPHRADHVVVEKSKRLLTLYHNNQPFLTQKIALGRNPVGAKTCSGDYKTPEGRYTVTGRNPASHYYRSLRLSYPNASDIAKARKQGCSPGGNIAIHGLENGYEWVGRTHRDADWTNGCIAVTNQEMDQLWRLIPNGTPVEIRP